MAKPIHYDRWTDQELEFLEDNYGRIALKEMREALRQLSGVLRTRPAIHNKASRRRVTAAINSSDALCLSEAARILGITLKQVICATQRHHFRTHKIGRYRFISQHTLELLRTHFTSQPLTHLLTHEEAGKLLDYSKAQVAVFTKTGVIPSHRLGHRVYIHREVVYELRRKQRQGFSPTELNPTPAYQAHVARVIRMNRERRAKSRARSRG